MINLDWFEAYEIGVSFIDQEHKDILSIMRHIKRAIENNDLKECEKLSNTLIQCTTDHFRHEELYLKKVQYPKLDDHKMYHQELLEQAHKIKCICDKAEHNHSLNECFEAMEEFLVNDVMNGDLEFISFLEFEGHIKRKLF